MKTVTIEGVTINDAMITEMQSWYSSNLPGDSTPDAFVSVLSDIQDFLSCLDGSSDNDANILAMIRDIVWVKKSLMKFIPDKKDLK